MKTIPWKIIADYGLLLTVLILGATMTWFARGIYTELKVLNQSLAKLLKKEDSTITKFFRK